MISTLVNAFTKGDLPELNKKLLHSTCWQQHNAKAFGQEKLQAIVIKWLKATGQCKVVEQKLVSQGQQQLVSLKLQPSNSDKTVNYSFWLETNGEVIKSVSAVVDTMQLAFSTDQTAEKVAQLLPNPDAFVLQDYDQQDHLQHDLATPSNVAKLDANQAEILESWWAVWSNAQLSAISAIYSDDARVELPGFTSTSSSADLFKYVLGKYSHLTRIFCQLEQVILDNEQVAVKWYLDGDENGTRIRVPFITLLTLKQGKIVADNTTSDILAHINRFNDSEFFNE